MKFLSGNRNLTIAGIVILFASLPVVFFALGQRQDIRQHASNFPPVNGNNFKIIANEDVSCPAGVRSDLTAYGGSFTVTNQHSYNQTINVRIHRFFCFGGSIADCTQNDKIINYGNKTFGPNQTINFAVPNIQPGDFSSLYKGEACGSYQTDIEFVGYNNGFTYQSAFSCSTGNTCKVIPSPTPTLIITPTVTLTPTPTLIITPTVTLTPTPTVCPTPGTVKNVKISCPLCNT